MKSRSFTLARRIVGSKSGRWAKEGRSRIERRYVNSKLNINEIMDNLEEFDILSLPQSKSGYWAYIIS